MTNQPICEMCNQATGMLLGRLGSTMWFSCRSCGWEFTDEQASEWAETDNSPEWDLEG